MKSEGWTVTSEEAVKAAKAGVQPSLYPPTPQHSEPDVRPAQEHKAEHSHSSEEAQCSAPLLAPAEEVERLRWADDERQPREEQNL